MEIMYVIPLIGFLLFCILIFMNCWTLKCNKVPLSQKNWTLKTYFLTLFLILFFLLFTAELIIQTKSYSFLILPKFLSRHIYLSNISNIAGVLFIVLSLVSMNRTLSSFQNSLRFGLDPKNLGELVTQGVFSYSRNPFFISILLLFLGISLVFPTIYFVTITILSVISIHFSILKEEKFMKKNYGEEYRKYCKKVRRYF